MILDTLRFLNISSKIMLNITQHNKIYGSKSGQSKSPAIFTRLDFYRFLKFYSKFSTSFFTVPISSSSCLIFLSTTRSIASFQTC